MRAVRHKSFIAALTLLLGGVGFASMVAPAVDGFGTGLAATSHQVAPIQGTVPTPPVTLLWNEGSAGGGGDGGDGPEPGPSTRRAHPGSGGLTLGVRREAGRSPSRAARPQPSGAGLLGLPTSPANAPPIGP